MISDVVGSFVSIQDTAEDVIEEKLHSVRNDVAFYYENFYDYYSANSRCAAQFQILLNSFNLYIEVGTQGVIIFQLIPPAVQVQSI